MSPYLCVWRDVAGRYDTYCYSNHLNKGECLWQSETASYLRNTVLATIEIFHFQSEQIRIYRYCWHETKFFQLTFARNIFLSVQVLSKKKNNNFIKWIENHLLEVTIHFIYDRNQHLMFIKLAWVMKQSENVRSMLVLNQFELNR